MHHEILPLEEIKHLNLTTSTNFEYRTSNIMSKILTHLKQTIQNIKEDVELELHIRLQIKKFDLMIHSLKLNIQWVVDDLAHLLETRRTSFKDMTHPKKN